MRRDADASDVTQLAFVRELDKLLQQRVDGRRGLEDIELRKILTPSLPLQVQSVRGGSCVVMNAARDGEQRLMVASSADAVGVVEPRRRCRKSPRRNAHGRTPPSAGAGYAQAR